MSTHGTPRPDSILAAAKVDFGTCDFCTAVHINFYDVNGAVFASACLPVELEQPFIDRFKAAASLIRGRAHAAPARRQ